VRRRTCQSQGTFCYAYQVYNVNKSLNGSRRGSWTTETPMRPTRSSGRGGSGGTGGGFYDGQRGEVVLGHLLEGLVHEVVGADPLHLLPAHKFSRRLVHVPC
jgi:hypothetical protein